MMKKHQWHTVMHCAVWLHSVHIHSDESDRMTGLVQGSVKQISSLPFWSLGGELSQSTSYYVTVSLLILRKIEVPVTRTCYMMHDGHRALTRCNTTPYRTALPFTGLFSTRKVMTDLSRMTARQMSPLQRVWFSWCPPWLPLAPPSSDTVSHRWRDLEIRTQHNW